MNEIRWAPWLRSNRNYDLLVRAIMLKLSPVMSWMVMSFHEVVELASPSHAMWQVVPALKTSAGAGSVGVTSARAMRGAASTKRAVKTGAENIVEATVILCVDLRAKNVSPWFSNKKKTQKKHCVIAHM